MTACNNMASVRSIIKSSLSASSKSYALMHHINHHNITELLLLENNLSMCGIGYNEVRILADVLPDTNVRSIDLSNNLIGTHAATTLFRALHKTKLQYVNLSKNYIDEGTIDILNLYGKDNLCKFILTDNP